MNINSKLYYKFEVTAREFSLIRRGLEALGPIGSKLVTELMEKQKKANDTIRTHMEASFETNAKEEEK